MKNGYLIAGLISTLASVQGQAATKTFSASGAGVSANFVLTYAINPNTGVLPMTSPNPVDPIGSYVITGISGTFSDVNAGISGTTITGIVSSNPGNPEPGNTFAPHSFGFYQTAAQNFSYDNLLYPAGSPQVAPPSDYPFNGGLFDIYGIVFTLADGNAVNLWSDGNAPGGLKYGIGVTDGTNTLDYSFDGLRGSVPEPATWAMMIAGFGMTGFAMRRRPTLRAA